MTDWTNQDLPVALDPVPTMFGTGRIDPLVAPNGSTEYSRAVAWINRRARRLAFGAMLAAKLVGDPIAAANITASTQPLVDFKNDQMRGVEESADEGFGPPATNWHANDN